MKLLSGTELFTQLAQRFPVELQEMLDLRNAYFHQNFTHENYNRESTEIALIQRAILDVVRA